MLVYIGLSVGMFVLGYILGKRNERRRSEDNGKGGGPIDPPVKPE